MSCNSSQYTSLSKQYYYKITALRLYPNSWVLYMTKGTFPGKDPNVCLFADIIIHWYNYKSLIMQ